MRMLIADGQSNVRFALRLLLEQRPQGEVVGEVIHARDLLSQIESTEPDLLVLDWKLPGLAGIGSLPAIRARYPDLFIVALSGRPEARRAALSAGADAFVSKTDPPEHLLAAIDGYRRKPRSGGES